MKFVIKIYQDGKLLDTRTTEDGWDFKWINNNYHKKIKGYINRGWKSAISSSSGIGGYELLYNKETMKSIYIAYKGDAITDLRDADGKSIFLNEVYKSENGHIFTFHSTPFGPKDEFYIRKSERFSKWQDYPMPTQEYIDNLKLHIRND